MSIFGMETVQKSLCKVSESIEKKETLALSMDFNGGTGMHNIPHITRTTQAKVLIS
jgi:hypothetical protein